jgi:hypothetical protein
MYEFFAGKIRVSGRNARTVSCFLGGAALPRYYFHILSNGRTIPDDEGMDLHDLLAAQAEGVASARDLALSADGDGLGKESRVVQITDAAGTILDTVTVLGDGRGIY